MSGYIPKKINQEITQDDEGKDVVFLEDYESEYEYWLKGAVAEIRDVLPMCEEIQLIVVVIPCFQGMTEIIPASVLSLIEE